MSGYPVNHFNALNNIPRNVRAVSAASFFNDLASEMILHLLPLYLMNVLGVRTVTVGFIEGLADSLSALLKRVSGWVSDRLGDRKYLTFGGYSISAISRLFLLIVSSESVIGFRLLDRFGKGIRTAPRDALIADSTPRAQHGLAYSLQRSADTAGAWLGLLAAASVIWFSQGDALALSRETFHRVVIIGLIPGVLAALSIGIFVKAPHQPKNEVQVPKPEIFTNASIKRLLLILFLFTL
jgi:sugar phosphate permease